MDNTDTGLPGGLQVETIGGGSFAREVNPRGWGNGLAKVVGAGAEEGFASIESGGGGNEQDTDEVVVALAVALPVEGVGILARITEMEGAYGVGVAYAIVGVAVGTAVVGDIHRAAGVAGGVTHHPVVGLAGGVEVPTIDAGILKIAEVGHCGGRGSKRCGRNVTFSDKTAAVWVDIDIVGHTRIEACHGVDGVIDMYRSDTATAGSEVDGVVFDIPSGVGTAGVGPGNGDGVETGVGDMEVFDARAGGEQLKLDVVDVGIPYTGRTQGADGYILTIAGEAAKAHGVFRPLGDAGDGDGLDGLEGGVGGALHHTHLEDGRIAGAAGSGPEDKLEGADGQRCGVDRREDKVHIVAIGSGSGVGIPVEAFATIGGMIVGGGSGDVGIVAIGSAVVEQCPARNEGRPGGAACCGM